MPRKLKMWWRNNQETVRMIESLVWLVLGVMLIVVIGQRLYPLN